ncbi:MAG: type II toxin-antitoxin system HicB family antitoxin [Bacteroidales bacterium]|nr:type II toxin-antitoxin system HicB family antitoxin [Bacteroidales bacterium]MCF8336367.1 type II toxin-antitoxin system HicB family antitoxin [Bacteroidales bacterium]
MKSVKYIVYREGDYYVSQCLNVEVSSFGESIQEAVDNLNEALELYFEDKNVDTDIPAINEALIGETFING